MNEVVVDRGANPYLTKIECLEHGTLITKVTRLDPPPPLPPRNLHNPFNHVRICCCTQSWCYL